MTFSPADGRKMDKISLKADDAFKELFAHEKVRKQFLSDVLGIPLEQIKSVRMANPFLRKLFRGQKQGILDVLLVLNDDTRIGIEMQVHIQKHWTERNLYYLGRMYTDDLMLGENYGKLHRCISISLLDFKLLPDTGNYHNIYRLRNREGEELTDLWEVHIIELGKELTGNRIDDWIRLFNATSQEEIDQIAEQNGRMRDVAEVVRQMGLIRTIRWFYDGYWRAKRDRWAEDEYVRDEGIAIGEARGRAEGKTEDIIHLLENAGRGETLPERIIQRIKSQKDEEVLKRWLLSAARAETVAQFIEQENLESETIPK